MPPITTLLTTSLGNVSSMWCRGLALVLRCRNLLNHPRHCASCTASPPSIRTVPIPRNVSVRSCSPRAVCRVRSLSSTLDRPVSLAVIRYVIGKAISAAAANRASTTTISTTVAASVIAYCTNGSNSWPTYRSPILPVSRVIRNIRSPGVLLSRNPIRARNRWGTTASRRLALTRNAISVRRY